MNAIVVAAGAALGFKTHAFIGVSLLLVVAWLAILVLLVREHSRRAGV